MLFLQSDHIVFCSHEYLRDTEKKKKKNAASPFSPTFWVQLNGLPDSAGILLVTHSEETAGDPNSTAFFPLAPSPSLSPITLGLY